MRGLLVAAFAAVLSAPFVGADDTVCVSDEVARLCVAGSRDGWLGRDGEPPRFDMTFTNLGRDRIVLPYPHPWWVEDDRGHLFASPLTAAVLVEIPPGRTQASAWEGDAYESYDDAAAHDDPRHLALTQAWHTPPGTYRISWPYFAEAWTWHTLAVDVVVEDGLPAVG